jgi:aminoglycoside phosphotransferase (APT) family kinase protein
VFLVGGEYVFRFARRPDVGQRVEAEIRLLPRLAPRLTIAIPRYEYVGRWGRDALPFVGYRLIPGEELTRERLTRLGGRARERVAQDLAAFLAALRTLPVEQARAAGVRDADVRGAILVQLAAARERIYPHADAPIRDYLERSFLEFLGDGGNFDFRPSLTHSDLAPEHVLVAADRGGLAGVIDFDMEIGDPDVDLLYAFWAGLGEDVLRHLPHPDPRRLERKMAFGDTREIVGDALHDLASGDTVSLGRRLSALRAKADGAGGDFLS